MTDDWPRTWPPRHRTLRSSALGPCLPRHRPTRLRPLRDETPRRDTDPDTGDTDMTEDDE